MRFIIRNDKDAGSFIVCGMTAEICRAKADRQAKALGWDVWSCSSEQIGKKQMNREKETR